jgi:hypothetical protein
MQSRDPKYKALHCSSVHQEENSVSSGMSAGLEIRETERVPLPSYRTGPIDTWFAVAPSIYINWVENRTLFNLLSGHASWLGIEPPISARGMPEDATREVRARYDEWNGLAFDAGWVTLDELVLVVGRLTTALSAMANADGQDINELLKLHRSICIDAVIAFLTVYQGRGFDTRIVFWTTPV